jgi:hypothetical protein
VTSQQTPQKKQTTTHVTSQQNHHRKTVADIHHRFGALRSLHRRYPSPFRLAALAASQMPITISVSLCSLHRRYSSPFRLAALAAS